MVDREGCGVVVCDYVLDSCDSVGVYIYIYKGLMAGMEDFFAPRDNNTCLNTISIQNALLIGGFDTDFIYTIPGSSSYRPKSLCNQDTTLCPGIR